MKNYSELLEGHFLPDSTDLNGPVLCRFDLNATVNSKGFPEDSPKFRNCAETLKEYKRKFPEAKWVLLTHQGRKGERECVSTLMHANILRSYGLEVRFCNEVPYGERVQKEINNLSQGEVLLLENTRSPPLWEWEKGLRGDYEGQLDHPITESLAEPVEYYINDAYEAAHRGDSSMTGLSLKFMRKEGKEAYLGHYTKGEIRKLERLRKQISQAKGVSLYAGGSKFKLRYHGELMTRFPQMSLFTGGIPGQAAAIAAGHTLNEENERFIRHEYGENIKKAEQLFDRFGSHRIFHPIDWFLEEPDGQLKSVGLEKISDVEGVIRDIGPKTVAKYTNGSSDVNILAGPPGMADQGYAFGTHSLLYGLQMEEVPIWVLGGHSATALPRGRELEQMKERIKYMAAGGAALSHLTGQEMPLFEVVLAQG